MVVSCSLPSQVSRAEYWSFLANMASIPQFLFYHVPKDDRQAIPALAQKYRDLRLTALRLSPNSFGSTVEAEERFADNVWQDRLLKQDLETFICAAASPAGVEHGTNMHSSDVTWIAQVTLRGPIDAESFQLPPEAGQPFSAKDTPATEERWQVLGLYVLSDFRGHKVAQRLCESAFEYLKTTRMQQSPECSQIRLRTMIKADNVASVNLFKRLGFEDWGTCTRAEGMVANGESPPEILDEGYTWRGGVTLARLLGS
ncbi:hypothetical protein KVT40_003307 [Elsinoe batatas]|uniref:N-acetyltransferase domain-containing protein n=1 Tax=Elsinoe batatas TaxID=2601811 RepID=A0A8K0L5P0_9PEZI|nr:hypothetical protein KVT40_003307 [Elsinoe batatas]